MEPIRIKVTEADAIVTQAPTITSGMTGLMVEFKFNETWEGFTKTAVFKAGDVVKDVVDIGTSCKVPPEVLVLPYRTLRIGVYGVSADGEVVIPTIWAAVDEIRLGADPSGDESTDPTLPVWQQILNQVRTPHFDLNEMGLPEIPLNGPEVGVSCDTSKLLDAAQNGPVLLTLRTAFSESIHYKFKVLPSAIQDLSLVDDRLVGVLFYATVYTESKFYYVTVSVGQGSIYAQSISMINT